VQYHVDNKTSRYQSILGQYDFFRVAVAADHGQEDAASFEPYGNHYLLLHIKIVIESIVKVFRVELVYAVVIEPPPQIPHRHPRLNRVIKVIKNEMRHYSGVQKGTPVCVDERAVLVLAYVLVGGLQTKDMQKW